MPLTRFVITPQRSRSPASVSDRIISVSVYHIDVIPPLVSRKSTVSSPVLPTNPEYQYVPADSISVSCKATEKNIPVHEQTSSVGNAGTFRSTITNMSANGIRSTGVKLNSSSRTATIFSIADISASPAFFIPSTENAIIHTPNAGTVVYIMLLR